MTVNWFGRRVALLMPAWALALAGAAVLGAVCVAAGMILARKEYVCSICGCSFRTRWYRIIAAPQHRGDRFLYCPGCGCKSWCARGR